jgi:hypothetical protein
VGNWEDVSPETVFIHCYGDSEDEGPFVYVRVFGVGQERIGSSAGTQREGLFLRPSRHGGEGIEILQDA